jgi:hypothetical protein
MLKPLPLLLMAGLLAGCASEPQAEKTPDGAPGIAQLSCYQAGWQAETVPVVYKRGGPEFWEKYDFMPAVGPVACR